MKTYCVFSFGPKQTSLVTFLDRLKLLYIEKGKQYLDPISETPIGYMIDIKTIYPIARILTYLFITGKISDDICDMNLRKWDQIGEREEDVKQMLNYLKSPKGVIVATNKSQ